MHTCHGICNFNFYSVHNIPTAYRLLSTVQRSQPAFDIDTGDTVLRFCSITFHEFYKKGPQQNWWNVVDDDDARIAVKLAIYLLFSIYAWEILVYNILAALLLFVEKQTFTFKKWS